MRSGTHDASVRAPEAVGLERTVQVVSSNVLRHPGAREHPRVDARDGGDAHSTTSAEGIRNRPTHLPRDPMATGMPKRPQTAYFHYLNSMRETTKAEFPGASWAGGRAGGRIVRLSFKLDLPPPPLLHRPPPSSLDAGLARQS